MVLLVDGALAGPAQRGGTPQPINRGLVLEALQGFLRDLPPHLMHADELDVDEQQEAA